VISGTSRKKAIRQKEAGNDPKGLTMPSNSERSKAKNISWALSYTASQRCKCRLEKQEKSIRQQEERQKCNN
jgi:hypothetical protein